MQQVQYPWILSDTGAWYLAEMFRFTTQNGTMSPMFPGVARLAAIADRWRLDYRIPWFRPTWMSQYVVNKETGEKCLHESLVRDGLWLVPQEVEDRSDTIASFIFPKLVIVTPVIKDAKLRRMIT